MTARRIGVLGGTFDPVHNGHLAAAEDVAANLGLHRVLFVPNGRPPHKGDQSVSTAKDRVAMVELAIADNQRFSISLCEVERPGPSFTVDTMVELRKSLPDTELFFLVGADALPNLHNWHESERLLAEVRLIIMDRDVGRGVDWQAAERNFPDIQQRVRVVHVAQLDISGEDIRRRVREKEPFRYQIPLPVARYIEDRGLYRT